MVEAALKVVGSFSLSQRALQSIHSAETGPLPPPLSLIAGSLVAEILAA